MSILPALGTTYESLDAFKRDVQGRGDSCSLKYSTRNSRKDQHLQLSCAGSGVESTCSSRVIARRTAQGDFRVTNVNQVHSCQEAADEAEWDGIDSNGKQDRLDDEEEDYFEGTGDYDDCDVRVRQSRSDSEDEWEGNVAGSESEESTSNGSEDPDSSTSSDSSNTLTKAKGDRKKDEANASTRFPPARNLRNEIAKLVVRRVSFPSPTQSFSEPPHRLLATLHAFAQQNGFSLYRRNNNKTTLQLNCSLNHTRNNTKPGGSCKFRISARRDQDGRWKVLPLTTQHNHSLSSTSTLSVSTASASSAAGSSSSRPPSQKFSASAGYVSLASHLQPDPAPPRYRHSLHIQPQSFPLTNTASSANLASLLRAFHPSFEAQHSLDYLYSIGVDSVGTLTQLLMMEDEGFERFIGGIEVEIGKTFRMMREDLQQELAE